MISGSVQSPIRSTSEGIGGLRTHWKKGIASQLAPPVLSAPSLPQPLTNIQPIKRQAQLPVPAKHPTQNLKTPVQPSVNREAEDSEIATGPDDPGGEIGLDEDDDLLNAVGRDKEVQGSLNKSHRNGTKTVRTSYYLHQSLFVMNLINLSH